VAEKKTAVCNARRQTLAVGARCLELLLTVPGVCFGSCSRRCATLRTFNTSRSTSRRLNSCPSRTSCCGRLRPSMAPSLAPQKAATSVRETRRQRRQAQRASRQREMGYAAPLFGPSRCIVFSLCV
jgi:hypothetical protein